MYSNWFNHRAFSKPWPVDFPHLLRNCPRLLSLLTLFRPVFGWQVCLCLSSFRTFRWLLRSVFPIDLCIFLVAQPVKREPEPPLLLSQFYSTVFSSLSHHLSPWSTLATQMIGFSGDLTYGKGWFDCSAFSCSIYESFRFFCCHRAF